MSSSLNVYAVRLDRLRVVVGSGDRSVIDAITTEQAAFLSSVDEIDDDAEMSCLDALTQLINGDIDEDGPGYLYGYALEAICAHMGEELSNICPIARATEWIDEIDTLLETTNVPVRLSRLVFQGSPISIPEPDDCPCIGYWSASEIAAALATFQSLDWSRVPDQHAETFAQIHSWLSEGATTTEATLIGFLS